MTDRNTYDSDMYKAWIKHPCTKELKRQVQERISVGINNFLSGAFISDINNTQAVYARNSGIAGAYKCILDIISIYIKPKEDKEGFKNV